jgi:hypothetical protein
LELAKILISAAMTLRAPKTIAPKVIAAAMSTLRWNFLVI